LGPFHCPERSASLGMFRHVPPVRSPLDLVALRAGWRASRDPGSALVAEASVRRALRERYAPAEVVFTDSGTSSLALALQMAAKGPARPIALPAYGCYDLATAADGAGCPVLLYDVDPATLSPDLQSLRDALAAGAGTIVVAHLYGVPANLTSVRALAVEFGAQIIDDAAQGAGATFGGVPLGLHGTLGVVSFGRGKGLTGGSGGALIVPPESTLREATLALDLPAAQSSNWRALLATTAQWTLARPALYGIPASIPFLGLGETVYRPPHPAGAITAFSLGVLSRTVELLGAELSIRRAHANRLRRALSTGAITAIEVPPEALPSYLRFPVRVPPALRAVALGARRLGVMPGYPTSLASLTGFGARCRNAGQAMPGADELAATLFTLPTHSAQREHDLLRLERWLETQNG